MTKHVVLATLAGTVFAAHAGLKYWTGGGYDADAYVQDGLLLHYDGIRNVGLNQPHSTTTTTWVNLANPGIQDLTKGGSGKSSQWLDDGFFFDGTNWFGSTGLTVASPYETEALIDANCSDHIAKGGIGYVFFTQGDSNANWTKWSLAVRNSTIDGIWFNTHYYTSDRPKIKNVTAFTYLTMIANDTYAAIFSGLAEPTGAVGRYGLKSGTTSIGSFTSDGWGIGGNPSGGTQQLVGTIKSFRHYSRVLSVEERTWNRAVDDARFFGRLVSVIPVTNAVIASSFAAVSANEPAGAYAVDSAGHAFTAPASTNVDGRAYACTGYTLETWDSATGDWSEPVRHDGEQSCTATETSRIRITWQWTAGDGIVTRYTTADYVQDGLVFHYDGIRNLGADRPHSCSATTWKNIAPNGGLDLNFHDASSGAAAGEWRADGYRFERGSYFSPDAAITLPSNQTIQVALHGTSLDQYALNGAGGYLNEAYFYYNQGTFNKGGALSFRKDTNATGNSWIDWATHGYGDTNARPAPMAPQGTPFGYVTAILADDYSAAFFGTSIPQTQTARWTANGSRRTLTSTPQVQTAASPGFGIGGTPTSGNLLKFRGVVKSFRFYGRVLSDEELTQNRMVDDYRFYGVIPVTNVVVATSHSFLSGNEKNGNYEISGRYTFGAPLEKQTDSRGFSYAFKGYTLETWDGAAQGWGDPVLHEGESAFEYAAGASPAKVRLTWIWEPSGNLRTAADYGLEDIVPAGLVLHYDGIKNIGAECADAMNETSRWSKVWVNLANEGAFTLTRKNKTTAAGGWGTDGFAFTNSSDTVGSHFQYVGAFTLAPAYTWQFLVDAKVAEQVNSTCAYLMFNAAWKMGSLGLRTNSDYKYALYYVPETAFNTTSGSYRPKIHDTGDANSAYAYATAIIDGKNAMLFEGTEYPTDGERLKTAPNAATAQTLSEINIGGGQGAQDFTGKMKSVRYYDRVLTTAELERNRNVDAARYFGALATTNVFVEAGGGTQAEMGAYKVEGAWTFTATTTAKKNGTLVPVVRYTVETLANGVWTGKTWHDGASYTYTEGTDPAAVRLTWHGHPDGTVIVVR